MNEGGEAERRAGDRYQLVLNLELIDVRTGEPMGVLVDISTDGLMLASETAHKVEGRYRMRLPLPVEVDGYEALELEATAAWTKPAMNPAFHRTGFRELQLVSGPHDALGRLIEDYHLQTV
ncbi:MAG: PilZ domain-containing protein [Halofilum sp. (in: g-proteobacteria)]|nr:PilZ domain-containing protein [Halofilum sp. (in: g-proteobacteria)]